jgi:hypothetical protein
MRFDIRSRVMKWKETCKSWLKSARSDHGYVVKVKPAELDLSVAESTVSLSNYLKRTGTVTQALFGSRRVLEYERDEPLPSMFRISPPQADTRSRFDGGELGNVDYEVADGALLSRSDMKRVIASWSPYVAAALFPCLVGVAAVHFAVRVIKPVSKTEAATPDRGVTATAASFADSKATWQTQSIAITPSSPAEPDAWNDTVETFKRLLAEQKASVGPGLQQTENEQVLGQIEAWSDAEALAAVPYRELASPR